MVFIQKVGIQNSDHNNISSEIPHSGVWTLLLPRGDGEVDPKRPSAQVNTDLIVHTNQLILLYILTSFQFI